MNEPIRVTLLTGFLGAGKTTLLNSLLAAPHGERIAVIENEFGAAGIDGDLLGPGATAIVELSNGCICCNVRGELSAALVDLNERRLRGEIQFDRILIEATGLADPGPLIQTFFWEDALRERFVLDGVLTLIDACHIMGQLDQERVAAAQVAFADRLLISKTDLVDDEKLEAVATRLRTINIRAPIEKVLHGVADWRDLLKVGGFSLDEQGLAPRGAWEASKKPAAKNVFGGAARSWDDAIGSLVLSVEGALDLDAVSGFVDALIEGSANDLLRYKGILFIAGEPRRLIFQGVHRIAGFDYGRVWEPGEKQTSRIVLIGRGLKAPALQAAFEACVVEPVAV
ncbi:MAG: GTP-binding protein [Betaproteobacteria bacterium]|nr:GTP-binding protein [Betaproteobacteria bacterium]